jgi:hypothetical protein
MVSSAVRPRPFFQMVTEIIQGFQNSTRAALPAWVVVHLRHFSRPYSVCIWRWHQYVSLERLSYQLRFHFR